MNMRISRLIFLTAFMAVLALPAHAQHVILQGKPIHPQHPPVEEMVILKPAAGVATPPAVKPSAKSAAKAAPEPASPTAEAAKPNAIHLRGLNKVTARVSELEGLLGMVMRFGNLEIIAHRCWQSAPEERPESAALLEIWELEPSEEPQRVFSGWMFASSPATSALEHAVYDITVVSCDIQPITE